MQYALIFSDLQRILALMGETLYPTPRLRAPHPAQRVSPYLWRGGPITRVPCTI
jgi:hypothetical protein